MLNNTPQSFRSCYSSLPCLMPQIWDDSGEEVEKLLGMGLLDISQLLRSSKAN